MKVYIDGSSLNNQSKNRCGGIGVFFNDDDERNISMKFNDDNQTNNRAELTACIMALEQIPNNENVIIITDSIYVIGCAITWIDKWRNNNYCKSNGKIILNLDLVKKLEILVNNHNVEFQHINSHKKQPPINSSSYSDWYGNMMADNFAVLGANS